MALPYHFQYDGPAHNRNRVYYGALKPVIAASAYEIAKRQAKRAWNYLRGGASGRGAAVAASRARKMARKPNGAKRTYVRSSRKTKLKTRVARIEKAIAKQIAKHTYRIAAAGTSRIAAVNQSVTVSTGYGNITDLQGSMANLRFFDSNTGGFDTYNPSAETAAQKFQSKIFQKIEIRNNYEIPVKVTLMCCKVKEDTTIAPVTAFQQGLVDQDNISNTSPVVYPTDSDQFKRLWKVLGTNKKTLMPGKTMTMSWSTPKFTWDPSFFDSHALSFQTICHSMLWLIRLEGIVAHDSAVATEQGLTLGGVDFIQKGIFTHWYDAGADLNDFSADVSGLDTFTNGPLVSNKPISDNQNYSIT